MTTHSAHGTARRLWCIPFALVTLAAVCLPGKAAAEIYDDGGGFIIGRVNYEGSPSYWEYTLFQNQTGVDAYDFHFYFTDASGKPVGDVINIDLDSKLPSGQSYVPTTVITDNGDVGKLGHGWWTDINHDRITSAVPEPSSWLLMLVGLMALAPRLRAPSARSNLTRA